MNTKIDFSSMFANAPDFPTLPARVNLSPDSPTQMFRHSFLSKENIYIVGNMWKHTPGPLELSRSETFFRLRLKTFPNFMIKPEFALAPVSTLIRIQHSLRMRTPDPDFGQHQIKGCTVFLQHFSHFWLEERSIITFSLYTVRFERSLLIPDPNTVPTHR